MAVLAVYSMKGGVGKTSLAVNLAWASANLSRRRTLLWDLDAQAAATFILSDGPRGALCARDVLEREVAPAELVRPTRDAGFDLIPADESLRSLDVVFAALDRKKRLRRLTEALDRSYDHVVLDCPPGLGATAEQVMRGAGLIVVPMVPSTLSLRAFAALREHLGQAIKGAPPLLPVFNLVDRRRASHRAALAEYPDYPVIPMASAVEQMAARRAAVLRYAPRSAAAIACRELWIEIERRLAKGAAAR